MVLRYVANFSYRGPKIIYWQMCLSCPSSSLTSCIYYLIRTAGFVALWYRNWVRNLERNTRNGKNLLGPETWWGSGLLRTIWEILKRYLEEGRRFSENFISLSGVSHGWTLGQTNTNTYIAFEVNCKKSSAYFLLSKYTETSMKIILIEVPIYATMPV